MLNVKCQCKYIQINIHQRPAHVIFIYNLKSRIHRPKQLILCSACWFEYTMAWYQNIFLWIDKPLLNNAKLGPGDVGQDRMTKFVSRRNRPYLFFIKFWAIPENTQESAIFFVSDNKFSSCLCSVGRIGINGVILMT